MGLFSSKKRHFVDTSVVRVVEDERVPNVLLTATVEAVLEGTRITETVLDQALHGSFRKVERMYRFARDGGYVYGLPDARVLTSTDGYPLAIAKLEEDLGRSVTVDYLFFRPINNFHMGWKNLTEHYGYDHQTNEITTLSLQKGWPVYLDKMVAVYNIEAGLEPEYTSLGNPGLSTQAGQTPVRPGRANGLGLQHLVVTEQARVGTTETESVELHVVWEEVIEPTEAELESDPTARPQFVLHTQVITIDLSGFDGDDEYYQARYRYNDNGTEVIGYWIHNPADNPTSALNQVFQTEYTNPGTYFPFVIFRRERENQASEDKVGTPAYESTRKLLDKIGMDFQEIADSIHENEDIEQIEQAVMMLAVPMTTDDPIQMDYLYRYFKRIHGQLPTLPQASRLARRLTYAPKASYAIEIKDADFSTVISFDDVKIRLWPKTIGPVGTLTNTVKMVGLPMDPGRIFATEPGAVAQTQHNVRYITRQITPSVCEEIEIINPVVRYDIFRDRAVEGGASDERLLIPLDYDICREMPPIAREDLYFRSLVFVFNSRVTQRVRWYERGVFKNLITIVGVIITLAIAGADGGLSATLAAALAAGGTLLAAKVLLVLVVKKIIATMVAQVVFTFVAQALGHELAFWLAVAAALYGGYKIYDAGKLVPSAQNLLQASTGLAQGAGQAIAAEIRELQEEMLALEQEQQELWEELEARQRELDAPLELDPLRWVRRAHPLTVFGENPQTFFERTIHSGNVGVQSLDYVSNFVENALQLPTTSQSFPDAVR